MTNIDKSCIYSAGITSEVLDELKSATGLQSGRFPFRYLGIPLASSRLSIAQFNPFVQKIADYTNSWAGKSLSYAGRAELIKSVLQGVDCFWLSILPIPAGVKQKVISFCRNFLWGGQIHLHKRPLVNWKTICLPKTEGGLGFKCLDTWNAALLSKTLWDIHCKKDSLWVKWLHHFYFKSTSIWDYHSKKEDSPLLKRLVEIKEALCSKEGSSQAAVLQMQSWVSSGKLSTKTAYNYFRTKQQPKKWTNLVWHSSLLPKQAFLLWLALQDKLRTKDKLHKADDRMCIFCKAEDESQHHLFFTCSFVKQVWDSVKDWLKLTRRLSTIKAAAKWLTKEARGTSFRSKMKKIAFATTIYSLWEARNLLLFENKKRAPQVILKKIQVQVYRILGFHFPDSHGHVLL